MMSLKKTMALVLFILFAATFPLQAPAKLFIETSVVSGKIAVIRDNIITLENGYSYYPQNEKQQLEVSEGQMVSIRYIIDQNGDYKYSEVVAGENMLQTAPPPEDTRKPKSKL